jgi:flagellar protein FlaG
MSIQVSSLSTGGGITVPVQKEQIPQLLPMERKDTAAKVDTLAATNLPGTQKTQTPELKQIVSDLEQISLAFNHRLKFVVDQNSKDLIVKVIDNETDKVIKVLPPEELQRLHSRIRETMGFLFDRMV